MEVKLVLCPVLLPLTVLCSILLPLTVLGLNPNQIPIGIFLDESSNLADYINETIRAVQSETPADLDLLPNVRLVNVSSFRSYKTQVCEVFSEGVFVTVAAENSSIEYSMMSLMESFQMPFITFSNQDLLDDSWKYKIRMTPSYTGVLAALENFYNWQHVFYIYNDDPGLARFERFYEMVNSGTRKVEIDLRQLKPSLENSYEVLRFLDSKYSQADSRQFNEKVLILDLSSEWMTQKILDQLVDLGMARDNYHIIPATLTVKSLNLDRLHYGGVTITGFQLEGLENQVDVSKYLAMDSLTLVSEAIQGMNQRREVFKESYRVGKFYNGELVGLPCYIPDNPLLVGSLLMKALRETEFVGRTGLVKFNETGYRVGSSFDIFQKVRGKTLTKAGSWNGGKTIDALDNIRPAKNYTVQETGFYNETFVVTTVLVKPYAMNKTGGDLNSTEQYEGYAIDLAKKLGNIIGFNFTVMPVEMHGNIMPNGSWNGMIGKLISGEADLAIADLTITSDRERAVDFSTPFMNLGISIMIRKPEKQKPSVFSFMEPLSNNVWLCIALSFTGVSLIIYIVSRVSPNEWKVEEGPDGEESVENEFTAQNSAWFVAGALMCQGSELSPGAPSNRVVGSAWWLFTLIIISSYTANLAAFLTVENIIIPIKNVQDLANIWPKIKYGTLNSGTTRSFFKNATTEPFKSMWKNMEANQDELLVPKAEDGIAKVRSSKGTFAFLFESTTNEYANQRKPCNTIKVGENLDSKNYGVATPRGHKLRHQVTMAILRLHESGELTKLQQTWWYDKGQCSSNDGGSSIKALSLSNVAGVFYILIGGLLIAMFCALLEFIFKSVQDAKKFKKSLRESMKSKARLSIAGESDDSPYYYLPRTSYRMSVDPPPA